MPLTNEAIARLNEITSGIHDKTHPGDESLEFIREKFESILKDGHTYDVDEIESWFTNEGTWNDRKTVIRIVNLAHYLLNRHEDSNPLRIADDGCGH